MSIIGFGQIILLQDGSKDAAAGGLSQPGRICPVDCGRFPMLSGRSTDAGAPGAREPERGAMPRKPTQPSDPDAAERPEDGGLEPEERRGLPGLGIGDADPSPASDEAGEGASSDGPTEGEAENRPLAAADDDDVRDENIFHDAPADETPIDETPRDDDPAREAPFGDDPPREPHVDPSGAPVDPAGGLVATEARELPHHADPAHEPHHEHHEEEGGSFASRALWVLVLLLVGIGVGLWAAPRIAPLLPAGLAPVAAWLSPPQVAADDPRIAALEERLAASDARIGELAAQADVDPRVEALVSETATRLAAEIEAVRAAAAPADDTETRQRLDRLDSALEGQSAEVASLKDQLSGTDLASSQQTEEVVQQIDVYRAELEGLRAEVNTLSDRVSTLASRIDEVAASSEERVAAAENRATEAEAQVSESEAEASAARDTAARQTAIAQVRAALASGAGFSDALYSLGAVPASLSAVAASGAVPMTQLRDRFPEAAHAAIRASTAAQAADQGIAARSRAFLEAQVASRSLEPQTGDAPDAVLSRMEDALRRGDLDAALAEADKLPPEAVAAMDDWLGDARRRAAAEDALTDLTADTSATN